MTRMIAAFLLWAFIAGAALAEPLYFVYLAKTDPAKEAEYKRFLDAVAPIWERHTMKVIMQAKVIEKLGGEDSTDANEIGVLIADSRENFTAYIADPDYQAIKALRHGAMQRFTVLEGTSLDNEAQVFLRKTPLIAASFSVATSVPNDANLTLNITIAAPVKGNVEKNIKDVKSAQFHALSYDDNPSVYLPEDSSETVLLIGENLLQ